jgi:ribose transport system permease protein
VALPTSAETSAPPAASAEKQGPRHGHRRALAWLGRSSSVNAGVAVMLLALILFLWLTESTFATSDNIVNLLETNASLLIVAVGLTFVMLARGFDLSLGGMLALTGVLVAQFVGSGFGIGFAMTLALVLALAGGLGLNGLLIAGVRLPFLVVTLGTASLFRGVALVLTDGTTRPLFDQPFLVSLGTERVLGVPWSVIIAFVVLVIAMLVLRYTGYGRMVYAVGGNEEAARIAGIPVAAVRFSVYGIAAVLAGLAGVLEAARLTSAAPTAATGIELTAAAAVLLGGTRFTGGRGAMLGTLLGVLFLGVLANGITLAEIEAYWQSIVAGIVVIAALLLDRVARGESE